MFISKKLSILHVSLRVLYGDSILEKWINIHLHHLYLTPPICR